MNSLQLRPSASYRWTRCAASASFESTVPQEPDSDDAREGTCAAWVADCVLRGDAHSAGDLIDRNHENGWLVTPDMAQHVQGYVDLVKSRGGLTTSEQFVRLTENIAGTLDSSTSATGPCLFVDDLKYGFKLVEVWDLPQLLIYAGAELMRLGFPPSITHVQIGIYQPRGFHPDGIYRVQVMTVAELWEKVQWIVARSHECLAPQPIATPGPQCTDCRAASSCYALLGTIAAQWSVLQDHRQRRMTAAEAAQQWLFVENLEKMVKAAKSALDAEISARIKSEHFPGIYMKPRTGHRKFKYPPETIRFLTGVDPFARVAMTPPELERAGADVGIVAAIAETNIIGHKLDRLGPNQVNKAFAKGK